LFIKWLRIDSINPRAGRRIDFTSEALEVTNKMEFQYSRSAKSCTHSLVPREGTVYGAKTVLSAYLTSAVMGEPRAHSVSDLSESRHSASLSERKVRVYGDR